MSGKNKGRGHEPRPHLVAVTFSCGHTTEGVHPYSSLFDYPECVQCDADVEVVAVDGKPLSGSHDAEPEHERNRSLAHWFRFSKGIEPCPECGHEEGDHVFYCSDDGCVESISCSTFPALRDDEMAVAFTVDWPDPDKMYLRMAGGTVDTTEFAGSKFGSMMDGASMYVDVVKNDERLGTVVVPARVWVTAVLDAMRG